MTVVLDGADEQDIAANRGHVDRVRLDGAQDDVSVDRFAKDVTLDIEQGNVVVDRLDVDASRGAHEPDLSVDRAQRHIDPALDHDIPVDGLGRDRTLETLDLDVGVDAVELDRHPRGHRDLVLDIHGFVLAPHRLDAVQASGLLDVDAQTPVGLGHDLHFIPIPALHVDIALEVVDLDAISPLDREGA